MFVCVRMEGGGGEASPLFTQFTPHPTNRFYFAVACKEGAQSQISDGGLIPMKFATKAFVTCELQIAS